MNRRRRAGFTLLELMMALAIGAMVVATMYTLSGASARAFQTQQRISQLQLQTRLALERVRRDIASTGFGGTPDSTRERICGTAGITTRLVGISLTDHDPTATTALGNMTGASRASTHGDRLRLLGNFATSDHYLIGNTGSASGNSILLQSNWQMFRRSFAGDPLGLTVATTVFTDVFSPGRVLHVEHPRGYHFFTVVGSSSVDSAGRTPLITLSPPLPSAGQCNFSLCVGCIVSPLMMIEYGIDTAQNVAPALVPNDQTVTGTNTVLYRRELNPVDNTIVQNTTRVVLEFAVNFDVTAVWDQAPIGQNPRLIDPPQTTIPAGLESRMRAVRVELAARSPDTDPTFPFPYTGNRNATSSPPDPLTSFLVFNDGRPGSSRVRTAMAEFVLTNLALRGL